MKLSNLLVNVLLVAVGIFVYDQIKTPDHAPAAGPAYEPLRADDPLTADDPLRADPAPRSGAPMTAGALQGSKDKADVAALEARIASLERVISRLPRSGTGQPTLPSGEKLPELSSTDVFDAANPSYDEKTLKTLDAYMEEITRRKQEQRQRDRVSTELTRLGLEFDKDVEKAIIDETLHFQEKSRELLRMSGSRDPAEREARRKTFLGLQEEYTATIKRLVPVDAAEKIVGSRIARGLGFYPAGATEAGGEGVRFPGGRGRRNGGGGNDR